MNRLVQAAIVSLGASLLHATPASAQMAFGFAPPIPPLVARYLRRFGVHAPLIHRSIARDPRRFGNYALHERVRDAHKVHQSARRGSTEVRVTRAEEVTKPKRTFQKEQAVASAQLSAPALTKPDAPSSKPTPKIQKLLEIQKLLVTSAPLPFASSKPDVPEARPAVRREIQKPPVASAVLPSSKKTDVPDPQKPAVVSSLPSLPVPVRLSEPPLVEARSEEAAPRSEEHPARIDPPAVPAASVKETPAPQAPVAQDPLPTSGALGEWLLPDGSARINVQPCGSNLCGIISWSKTNERIGTEILRSMKPTGESRWEGAILDPRSKRTYQSTMTLKDSSLQIEGCILGFLCRAETLTRG